jgi:hypothetical protein
LESFWFQAFSFIFKVVETNEENKDVVDDESCDKKDEDAEKDVAEEEKEEEEGNRN